MGSSADHPSFSSVTPYGRLWQLMGAEKRDVGIVVVYAAAVGVFSLAIPVASQALVNTVAFNVLLQPIIVLTFIVLAMLGVGSILRLIQTTVVETIQRRIFVRLSLDLAYRLPRMKIDVFDQHRGTELLNRFFEIVTVQKAVSLILLDGLAIILQAFVCMVLLAFYHPLLLAFDLFLILCIFLVLLLPARGAVKTSMKESKAKYHVAAWLEEIARNPLVFRLESGPDYALGRADLVTSGYINYRKKHFKILRRQIANTLILHAVISALFLGLGSFLVIKEQLTLGQLVASEIIVNMIIAGFAKFGKYLESFYDLLASLDKLGSLLDLPMEKTSGESFPASEKPFSISLKDVSFAYHPSAQSALSNINIEIAPGFKVGLYGINGSGKSTLFDLLIGLRSPTSGSVEINGIDVREVTLESLRRQIALVRKAEIFDGSVLDNIRMGHSQVTIDEVRETLRNVGLLDDIAGLPDGLMTHLSGTAGPLSAGQAQKLMLARVLVSKPKLILLDEALEHIDEESKDRLIRTLLAPNAPWTVLMASHEAKDLNQTSRIISLERGHIVGDVSSSSLLLREP